MVMMEKADQKAEYKKGIEAALFVAGKPLSLDDLAQVVGIASMGHLGSMIEELIADYKSRDSALQIAKVGDKYEMYVSEPYASRVASLAGQPDIGKSALKILAYISKNEPVMQSKVVKYFGSSTYDHVKELVDKEFIVAKKDRQVEEPVHHNEVQG
ncbi:segregation and condensation protein B, partial [mine drainage metagenome]